jgi:hypothetical protein
MERHEIEALRALHGFPAVTILLPTEQGLPGIRRNSVRVRNLVRICTSLHDRLHDIHTYGLPVAHDGAGRDPDRLLRDRLHEIHTYGLPVRHDGPNQDPDHLLRDRLHGIHTYGFPVA